MNLKEFDEFKLGDVIHFHNKLNPAIFAGDDMKDDVRIQLLNIAEDFVDHLGIQDLGIDDITISGSSAAYSYTKYSDIDLHIVVDYDKFHDDDVYRELFDAKKTVYNDTHNIKIGGYDVELYVQDSRMPVISLGEYSVLHNKWIRLPRKRRANLDQAATKLKYEKLLRLSEFALTSRNPEKIKNLLRTIKKYRQAGLDYNGEFGPENLAYKALRVNGVITKLYDRLDKLHDERLSLPESKPVKKIKRDELTDSLFKEFARFKSNEDRHPNDTPPGPEFKPTMPAGTVKVDVSDVYDWYKLGMHISDLDKVNPDTFGKGPPSTIMAFGSEPEEHEYIKDLENIGLTTTDIDPKDPNQPKGMKRQKVDPTYNVNEIVHSDVTSDEYFNDPTESVRMGDFEFNARTFTGGLSDPNARGLQIRAYDPSQPKGQNLIGSADFIVKFDKKGNQWLESDDTEVNDEYRGKGVAAMMYAFAKSLGNDIKASPYQSQKGRQMWSKWGKDAGKLVGEASGYVPSEKEKNDPRFKTALTVDIKPNSIKDNAKRLGSKVTRAGIPPLLRP